MQRSTALGSSNHRGDTSTFAFLSGWRREEVMQSPQAAPTWGRPCTSVQGETPPCNHRGMQCIQRQALSAGTAGEPRAATTPAVLTMAVTSCCSEQGQEKQAVTSWAWRGLSWAPNWALPWFCHSRREWGPRQGKEWALRCPTCPATPQQPEHQAGNGSKSHTLPRKQSIHVQQHRTTTRHQSALLQTQPM